MPLKHLALAHITTWSSLEKTQHEMCCKKAENPRAGAELGLELPLKTTKTPQEIPHKCLLAGKSLSSFPKRINLFPFLLSKISQKSPKYSFLAELVLLQVLKCICWHHQHMHPGCSAGLRSLVLVSCTSRWYQRP